jgi:5-methylcytosine-specific restriction endonuclease McrA
MSSRGGRTLKRRVWLLQERRCYWCSCETFFHEHVEGQPTPENAVTVDHVYPAKHARRLEARNSGKPSPFVIACWACNNKRGGTTFRKYHEVIGKTYKDPIMPSMAPAEPAMLAEIR